MIGIISRIYSIGEAGLTVDGFHEGLSKEELVGVGTEEENMCDTLRRAALLPGAGAASHLI